MLIAAPYTTCNWYTIYYTQYIQQQNFGNNPNTHKQEVFLKRNTLGEGVLFLKRSIPEILAFYYCPSSNQLLRHPVDSSISPKSVFSNKTYVMPNFLNNTKLQSITSVKYSVDWAVLFSRFWLSWSYFFIYSVGIC